MREDNPSGADPLGAIADEFVAAFRQGKRPSVAEFARRHPVYADAIRDLLPALVLMEQAKPADDSPRGTAMPPADERNAFAHLWPNVDTPDTTLRRLQAAAPPSPDGKQGSPVPQAAGTEESIPANPSEFP